jgi:hypothetical protein
MPSSAEAALPESFWVQDFQALGIEEPLQLIYTEVAKRLRDENKGADTLELMLIERVALLYVLIRHKESKQTLLGGFANDRSYKETFQLWATMAADLRKQRTHGESQDVLKEQILAGVQRAVMSAVKSMPKDVKQEVQTRLLEELEGAGI